MKSFNKKIFFLMMMLLLPVGVNATGVILSMVSGGPDYSAYPGVIQIRIEGGFDNASCDPTYAAIRNTSDRTHLISLALTAYTTQKPVHAVLNSADKYYSNRCTISRLSF